MTPSIWLSCNPDPDSFLFDWVKWWLYPEGSDNYGLPDPEKNGKVRWLIRREGNIFWGDSKEEMIERYGEKSMPISFQVLLGTIYDNPVLMENQPEYLSNLEALPNVERRRLLLGDWTARAEGQGYWKRSWCPELIKPHPRSEVLRTVRAWDLAGSVVSDAARDVDYSVGVKMDLLRNGEYVITDVVRFRARFGEVERKILEVAAEDGPKVDIVTPVDPGAAGKAAARMLAKSITGAGFYVRMKPVSKSKLDRFRPLASACENGLVSIVKNCCDDLENKTFNDNTWFYNELESFSGGRRGHDDAVDAASDAFEYLATSKKIPVGFKLPSFTQSNPFALD